MVVASHTGSVPGSLLWRMGSGAGGCVLAPAPHPAPSLSRPRWGRPSLHSHSPFFCPRCSPSQPKRAINSSSEGWSPAAMLHIWPGLEERGTGQKGVKAGCCVCAQVLNPRCPTPSHGGTLGAHPSIHTPFSTHLLACTAPLPAAGFQKGDQCPKHFVCMQNILPLIHSSAPYPWCTCAAGDCGAGLPEDGRAAPAGR